MTVAKGTLTAYAIDEFGFVLPLVVTVFAIAFWMKRRAAMMAAEQRALADAPV